jgi:molybdenum cofactor synthesis domain-containing protein
MDGPRRLLSARIISVGSELTVGETRDTNAGDIARSLTGLGVRVERIEAVPDDLEAVADAFRGALARTDVVVSTGGLGPTPDDLTREAIAVVVGEEPAVDPELEAWLRGLWTRRGIPMPDLNLKQAWLIPSAVALPNANGTAPGWWVDRPDGRVAVLLPGPPREMWPIWTDVVLPRLRERGAGTTSASRTFRLTGIGESLVAERLGDELLRAAEPDVATYARWDGVDVRISARGADAAAVVASVSARVLDELGDHVWAEGDTTWPDAIGAALETAGWSLASVEIDTGGSFAALVADRPWSRLTEALGSGTPAARDHADPDADTDEDGTEPAGPASPGLEALARRAMEAGGATVGVAIRARPRRGDTAVGVVVVLPGGVHHERRLVFLGGPMGRTRAGLTAAAVLLAQLRRALVERADAPDAAAALGAADAQGPAAPTRSTG